MKKYKVYCWMTGYNFYSDDFREADEKAFQMQCKLYDNVTNELLKDYE